MRTLALIPHPNCRISILGWNGKYILKFEMGDLEQTYKIAEHEVSNIEELKKKIQQPVIQKVMERFRDMQADLDFMTSS